MTDAIIDANVVVAGMLSRTSASPSRRLVDLMVTGEFPFLICELLIAEYDEVLHRPSLVARSGTTLRQIEVVLGAIAEHGTSIEIAIEGVVAPDPMDRHVWAMLSSSEDAVLVTRDRALLEAEDAPGPVMTPAAFVVLHLGDG